MPYEVQWNWLVTKGVDIEWDGAESNGGRRAPNGRKERKNL